ncbi:phage major capsid protein [Bradyrhizobium sp. PUT101]|uniref:phage major capsid protein n=1 Tax=Bradyrhizobium sp. PUT101 TaxID=3447427 RepID=UPI003F82F90B
MLKPFIPDRTIRSRPSDAVIRAVVASARNVTDARGIGAERTATTLYPGQQGVIDIITKGTVTPTTSSADLTRQAITDLLINAGGATSGLAQRALSLQFDGTQSILIPTLAASGDHATFVAEAGTIPIRQLAIDGALITPFKLACAFLLTRELIEGSPINAEQVIRALINRSIALGWDTAVLSADAATALRPAGVLNGIAALPATAGGGQVAAVTDLAALAAAVGPVAGSQLAFVCSLSSAIKIAAYVPSLAFPVLVSAAVDDDTVIAIAVGAFATAANPEISVDVSREAVVHAEDTTPLAIGTAGNPNAIAAPARSLWQTDTLGIRLTMRLSWALCASGAVAWTENITW